MHRLGIIYGKLLSHTRLLIIKCKKEFYVSDLLYKDINNFVQILLFLFLIIIIMNY